MHACVTQESPVHGGVSTTMKTLAHAYKRAWCARGRQPRPHGCDQYGIWHSSKQWASRFKR